MTIDKKLIKKVKKIAKNAGHIILNKAQKKLSISYKNEINLVTNVDKTVEKYIIENLKKIDTGITILSEETSAENLEDKNKWIIDPIDGTTNFVHGFPFFCISIALMINGKIKLGVVYDPNRNELFYAVKNQGAYLNEKIIKVTKVKEISKSLLATGFSYGFKTDDNDNVSHFKNFLYNCRAIRRAGAAALDLCYVACGRLDGFWEFYLSPWDTAAGMLMVLEAGGKITNSYGENYSIYDKSIVSSNSKIHNKMLEILSKKE